MTIDELLAQHERDRAEILRLDVALAEARAELARLRPVYEAAAKLATVEVALAEALDRAHTSDS